MRALFGDLLVELPGAPVAAAGADEGCARVGKLLQPVLAARGLAPDRRPVREPERKDLAALDSQRAGGSVDRDAAHGESVAGPRSERRGAAATAPLPSRA